MRNDIIEYLQKEVRGRCEKPSNKFGMGCYYHIEAVVKNAALLADSTGADKEVVVIAAWLHDIASVTDYSLYEEHHIHGAKMAEEILRGLGYDSEKTALAAKCVLNHRGSVDSARATKEEQCVADADAISHFDSVPSLLYLAYVTKGMPYQDGLDFVIKKLDRSWKKLSDYGKEFFKDKYITVMKVLGKELP